MECPKCGCELAAGEAAPLLDPGDECPACGVVLAKAFAAAWDPSRLARAPRDLSAAKARGEPLAQLGAPERRALVTGGAIGLAAAALPLTRYLLSYAVTVFHELGHTAVAWAFGYPTVPSFDFAYGGGISIHFGRSTTLALLAAVGVGALVYRLRRTSAFLPGVVFAAGYALASLTRLHDALFLAAGHGAELAIAGLCLYRAAAPLAWPAFERACYAATAAFVLALDAAFGWRLLASVGFRRSYEQAKGGGHWMDLSRIAEDHFGVDLSVVAVLFCLAVVATPVAAYLAAINRSSLVRVLRLSQRDP